MSLSRGRLPPVINHSTLAYVCHYPGADCHQSSTIPPWPMCVPIQGKTATSHQPFHPGLCVSLSRGRLPPVINHSTLAYVCPYPGPVWGWLTIFEKGGPWGEIMPKRRTKALHDGPIYNLLYTDVQYTSRQLTPSRHTTGSTEPFCCLPLWPYVWSSTGTSVEWGLKSGNSSATRGGGPDFKV